MKKLLFVIAFAPLFSTAQKIIEDKVDDFTHMHVVRTDWEMLYSKFSGVIIHARISKLDTLVYLELKLMGAGVVGMAENTDLLLKMANDSVVTLKNLKSTISCIGCGAVGMSGSKLQGIELSFPLPASEKKILSANEISKLRIYLTGGFVEENIKSDDADTFADMVKLIL